MDIYKLYFRITNSFIANLIGYFKSFFVDKHTHFMYKNNLEVKTKLFFTKLFWKNPDKKTKACSIYKTEKFYKIMPLCPVAKVGIFRSEEPVIILPLNVTIEELKNAIFQAINESKLISYKEYMKTLKPNERSKNYLKILKEKSWKSFYRNSTNCSIHLKNNILEIFYHKCTERGLIEEEKSVKMEYSKENELKITEEIIKILQINT